MNARKLAAVALAALLVSAGAAAAMPGNAPDDAQADDNADDADANADDGDENADANASEMDDADANADDVDANASSQQGPPVEMPEQVPDFVSTLHQKILNTDGSLGDVLPDVTPDDAEQGDSHADQHADGNAA